MNPFVTGGIGMALGLHVKLKHSIDLNTSK
jgi:hypothetical protein